MVCCKCYFDVKSFASFTASYTTTELWLETFRTKNDHSRLRFLLLLYYIVLYCIIIILYCIGWQNSDGHAGWYTCLVRRGAHPRRVYVCLRASHSYKHRPQTKFLFHRLHRLRNFGLCKHDPIEWARRACTWAPSACEIPPRFSRTEHASIGVLMLCGKRNVNATISFKIQKVGQNLNINRASIGSMHMGVFHLWETTGPHACIFTARRGSAVS